MRAGTRDGTAEWDELPVDGSDAWLGCILLVGSSLVSLKILGWVAATVKDLIMQ